MPSEKIKSFGNFIRSNAAWWRRAKILATAMAHVAQHFCTKNTQMFQKSMRTPGDPGPRAPPYCQRNKFLALLFAAILSDGFAKPSLLGGRGRMISRFGLNNERPVSHGTKHA
ncbi:MAG: hypothetical protein KGQ79_01320 [Proteobacteria bacterium]|nr:hypothetical protein [Pseudomonadota bacterium]